MIQNFTYESPESKYISNYYRYHELSEKEILDHLLHQQRYDKRERPPVDGKRTIPSVHI